MKPSTRLEKQEKYKLDGSKHTQEPGEMNLQTNRPNAMLTADVPLKTQSKATAN